MTPAQLSKNLTPNTVAKIASYTATNDDWAILASANAGNITITLPDANIHAGRFFYIKKTDSSANTVTVNTAGGTIDGAGSVVISAQYGAVFVISDGTNYFTIVSTTAGGGGGLVLGSATKTANYSITDSDFTILANAPAATPITITLPTAVGRSGRVFEIKKINAPLADTITIASAGGTIDGAATQVITVQYVAVSVQSDGTNWFII